MELILFEQVTEKEYLKQLRMLLELADQEFIPPLSSRSSTTQGNLNDATSQGGIEAYFAEMKTQPMVLALDGNRVAGFMAFRHNHTCGQIPPEKLPNLYASTSVVHPNYRGQGLMRRFYETMICGYPDRGVFTRTWGTNHSHLHVLQKLNFREICRLKDHRGPGMDTVYFERLPDTTKQFSENSTK